MTAHLLNFVSTFSIGSILEVWKCTGHINLYHFSQIFCLSNAVFANENFYIVKKFKYTHLEILKQKMVNSISYTRGHFI